MYLYPDYNLSTTDLREFPGGTIYNGDCLDAIKTLPAASVDCIITDPPYFLGMTHNGQKGAFKDLSICRPFYRELFEEFRRVCRPEACVYFFCDWRGYAFYYPLFDEILKAHNMLVWDKLGRVSPGYWFSHELVLFHRGNNIKIYETSIIKCKSLQFQTKAESNGMRLHPTQKPVALIQKFIADATKPGDVILDTFGGSGTTAVAAVRSGRRFILMEQDEGYYHTACKRLEDEYRQ